MRPLPVLLALMLVCPLSLSAEPPECATCEQLTVAPQTGIFVMLNDLDYSNQTIEIVAFYENASASPPRQPLHDTIVLVEVSNPTGLNELRKTYTDAEGKASFRFNAWNTTCLNFKVMYCPYCIPTDVECEGFKQCVKFANLDTEATNADGVDTASDAVLPAELNYDKYLPSVATGPSWCPPPEPLSATPAICFPLILLFSLLSGALYLTGRNPFMGFNIGSMRIGQHVRYQARGRGFSMNFTQVISAVASVAQSAKAGTFSAEGAKKESKAAWGRSAFGLGGLASGTGGIRDTLKRRSDMRAGGAAAAKKGQRGSAGGSSAAQGGASQRMGAGGVSAEATGAMQGTSGRDILGGTSIFDKSMWSASNLYGFGTLLRLATFVALGTTLGRAIDSIIFASSGKSGMEMMVNHLTDHGRTAMELSATINAARGEHSGWMVDRGDGTLVEMRQPPMEPGDTRDENGIIRNAAGEARFIVIAQSNVAGETTPAGERNGMLANREVTITFDREDRVSSLQMNVFINGQAIDVRVTGTPGSPVFETQTSPGQWARMDESDRATFSQAFGAFTSLPMQYQPGMPGAGQLVDQYASTMSGLSMIMQNAQQQIQLAREEQADRINSQLGQDPDSRTAVTSVRYDVAAEALGLALGIPTDEMRAGAPGHTELFDGIERGSSTIGGSDYQRSGYETVALAVHDADSGAGSHGLSSLGSRDGVGALASGSNLSEEHAAVAQAVLPGMLGNMSVRELMTMNQDDLRQAVAAQLAGRNDPATGQPYSPESIDAISRGISPLAPQIRGAATDFHESLSGTDPQLRTRLEGADLTRISALSGAGSLMRDDNIPQLLLTRPESLSAYNMGPGVADAVREYHSLSAMQQATALPSIQTATGPQLDMNSPGAVAAVERLRDATFDYGQASMVSVAREERAFSDDMYVRRDPTTRTEYMATEYGLASRGLDSGIYTHQMDSTFGLSPAPGVVLPASEVPAEIRVIQETARQDNIDRLVREGDYSTARAEIATAVEQFNTAARSARALGDTATARRFEQASESYSAAFGQIDSVERSGGYRPPSPPAGGGTTPPEAPPSGGGATPPVAAPETAQPRAVTIDVGDTAALMGGIRSTASGHSMRRHEDLIEVKEHIEQRMPRDKRPDELYAGGSDTPLTPDHEFRDAT